MVDKNKACAESSGKEYDDDDLPPNCTLRDQCQGPKQLTQSNEAMIEKMKKWFVTKLVTWKNKKVSMNDSMDESEEEITFMETCGLEQKTVANVQNLPHNCETKDDRSIDVSLSTSVTSTVYENIQSHDSSDDSDT